MRHALRYYASGFRSIYEFALVVFYSLIGRQDEILDSLSPDKPLGRAARADELIGR